MRWASRVDDNHSEILKVFTQAGCSVKDVSRLKGFVDAVIGIYGQTALIEIKDGNKPPSARKLTKDEQEFHDGWKGGPIYIVHSPIEAMQVIKLLARRKWNLTDDKKFDLV